MSLCHAGTMVMVRTSGTKTDPRTSRESNMGTNIQDIWGMSGMSGMSDIVDIAPCLRADL